MNINGVLNQLSDLSRTIYNVIKCVVALILDFAGKGIGRNNNALQGYQNSIKIVPQAMSEIYIDWFELAVKCLTKSLQINLQ
jgi:hypothetical protein